MKWREGEGGGKGGYVEEREGEGEGGNGRYGRWRGGRERKRQNTQKSHTVQKFANTFVHVKCLVHVQLCINPQTSKLHTHI